jgi:hypothetical protein
MMLTVLALSAASSAMAATKVATRMSYSQCTPEQAGFGSTKTMSSVLNGCSELGYLDCTAGTFISNSTDGLMSCANKVGDKYNVSAACQGAYNMSLTCADIDGTKAATVTMWSGNSCNGTATPLGVITATTCTFLTMDVYVKMWTNTTGQFVATYGAAGCGSADQTNIVKLASTGTSGCSTGVLGVGQESVKWALLENPTSAPTVAGNGTNTSAPVSSGAIVAASLASAVVAAATLML